MRALQIHNHKNRERPKANKEDLLQGSKRRLRRKTKPIPLLLLLSFFLLLQSDRVFCVSSSSVEVRIGQSVDLLGLYDDIAGSAS